MKINLGQSVVFDLGKDVSILVGRLNMTAKPSNEFYQLYRDLVIIHLLAVNTNSNLQDELKYESQN